MQTDLNQKALLKEVFLYSDQWGNKHPAGQPADTFRWEEHKKFPVGKMIGAIGDTPASLKKWFKDQQQIWADEGYSDRFDDMLDREIKEPVYGVDLGDGFIYLWDGNHRSAAAIVAGRETIPAIIGKPLDQNLIIVYHGTNQEFDAFDGPAYFTEDIQDAATYGKRVIKAHINIKDFWDIEEDDFEDDHIEFVAPEMFQKRNYKGAMGMSLPSHGIEQKYFFVFDPDQIKIIDPDVTYEIDQDYRTDFKGNPVEVAADMDPECGRMRI